MANTEKFADLYEKILREVSKVIIGKSDVIDFVIMPIHSSKNSDYPQIDNPLPVKTNISRSIMGMTLGENIRF